MNDWIFLSSTATEHPQYLAGETEHANGVRTTDWTCNEHEAISFPTAHDAWLWISTRLGPQSVLLTQKGDASMLARREPWSERLKRIERDTATIDWVDG